MTWCLLLALLGSAQASLRGKIVVEGGSMSAETVKATVLEEVLASLGSEHRVTSQRLQAIEEALKPTWQAVPKNVHGNLEDAAARYVLHRLFVSRHAMHIKGLDSAWNGTTKQVLREHVPSYVLSLFESRLEGQGLALHELTVLAATLEHLIHDEAVTRLSDVYQQHGHEISAKVSEAELQDLIDGYMSIFLVGEGSTTFEERERIAEAYPGWHRTRDFTSGVRQSMVKAGEKVNFTVATRIVEEIGERYGRWQDSECQDLRGLLSKYEHESSGRVMLKDFYGAALSGNWQFSESVEYLRELGALDESEPQQMSVMIPNYLYSQSNCVASSSIFSVCCINECEALLGHLERDLASHEASVEKILETVAKLPSGSQAAARPSAELRARLAEVAAEHGGMVPLHGRLFSQWLHHAYPRECPYPHLTEKKPMTADEWSQVKGKQVSASKEEMKRIAGSQKMPVKTSMPWSQEEKLVAKHQAEPAASGGLRKVFWFLAAAGIVSQMLRIALHSFQRSQEMLLPVKQHAC